jgi:hypothetical protein
MLARWVVVGWHPLRNLRIDAFHSTILFTPLGTEVIVLSYAPTQNPRQGRTRRILGMPLGTTVKVKSFTVVFCVILSVQRLLRYVVAFVRAGAGR